MPKPRAGVGQKTADEDLEIIRKMGVKYGDSKIANVLATLGAKTDGRFVTLAGHDVEKVNKAVDCLRGAGVAIEAIVPQRFGLEDILVEVMGDTNQAPPTSPPTARPAKPAGG